MIFFGAIKWRRGLDESHDRLFEAAAFVEVPLGSFGRGLLVGRMIKNHGPILIADIRSLAIQGSWIVVRPKNIQQLIVTHDRRIEFHLDDFGVAGCMTAHIFVGGVFGFATSITDASVDHARHGTKRRFDSPETACSESRFLCRHAFTMKRTVTLRNCMSSRGWRSTPRDLSSAQPLSRNPGRLRQSGCCPSLA